MSWPTCRPYCLLQGSTFGTQLLMFLCLFFFIFFCSDKSRLYSLAFFAFLTHSEFCSTHNLYIYLKYRASYVSFTVFQWLWMSWKNLNSVPVNMSKCLWINIQEIIVIFIIATIIKILSFLWKPIFIANLTSFIINSCWYFHLPEYTGMKLTLLNNSYTYCYLPKQNLIFSM